MSSSSTSSSKGNGKKIVIGICAMNRKATSKPMRAIMSKIMEYYPALLEYFIFPEKVILNDPIEEWPLCDCLISFHSTDFPLHKAIEYVTLRRPYVINDLNSQYDLLDRRKVFRTLAKHNIEHPRHGVLLRNDPSGEPDGELIESGDHIEVNGMVFNKPFVEKPISAEDHNIYIYFPSNVGGGSQRLFRKIDNRSSKYSPVAEVRKQGSFIYEDFIPADGTDVKVYAVGPFYAHAEARKAPGLDGKVERDANGKEVRYPVILSAKEKAIARKIVVAFKQTVCGFDLLRANGKSYVCDVNGFSFVKTSHKYYEDTARILGETIIQKMVLHLEGSLSAFKFPLEQTPILDLGIGDDPPMVSTPSGKLMELRCVIAVIRHGDRTPKQKMKVVVDDQRFMDLFVRYNEKEKSEIKMKRPNQLTEVLELAKKILVEQYEKRNAILQEVEASEELNGGDDSIEHRLDTVEEAIKKWEQIRTVLEMYGHFSGINRKVQLKRLKKGKEKKSDEDSGNNQGNGLLLILKWGGELTKAGTLQAEALGKLFRTLYPGIRRTDGKISPEDTQGLGFLRLHSTYRHDLKIYASDEGRVQMTAAAFAKGMLALEGELTPILIQMVKTANTDGLLDDDCHARDFQGELKTYLHQALQVDRDWTPKDYQELNPDGLRSITNAMEFIKNPRKMCNEIAGYVKRMCDVIDHHKLNRPAHYLYQQETWDLAQRRWTKELREFQRKNKNGDIEYDISKIPDIYDNIKYDMEHNPDLCAGQDSDLERFYLCVKNMADIVVPQEYGIKKENKIRVAQRVCTPLLNKIKNDLHRCSVSSKEEKEDESQTRLDPRASTGIATPFRHVRTRLYFTSESHIHTLMNLIRYGGLCSPDDRKWQRAMNFLSGVTEFNYMTQVVLMVYEDRRATDEGERFHIELLFSPGLYPCFLSEKERIYEQRANNKSMSKSHSREGGCSPHNHGNGEGKEGSLTVPPLTDTDDLSISSITKEKLVASKLSGLVSPVEQCADSDDHMEDLNDSESVNLVALDELRIKDQDKEGKPKRIRHNTGGDREKAMEEGDMPREDPDEWRRERRNNMEGTVAKSPSQVSVGDDDCQATVGPTNGRMLLAETKKAMSAIKEEKEREEKDRPEKKESTSRIETNGSDEKSRRSRFPYKFKHHTVNLLAGAQNRLISRDVLLGKFGFESSGDKNKNKNHFGGGPAVLSTAIIARSSSAPRLQTYKAEDDLNVSEIKRFWPPLRSLETLHDAISFRQFDKFLSYLLTSRTPLPSPPKTPLPSTEAPSEPNLSKVCEQLKLSGR